MNSIKPPFPTIEEIKADLVSRGLSKPSTNWWVVVTRRSIGAYQTRIEADSTFNFFAKNAIEQKAYLLKMDGTLLDATLSFDPPKPDTRSIWRKIVESFNSLI